MFDKGKFICCMIGIAILASLTPEIVSFFMNSEGGVMLTTNYYIKYITTTISIEIGLLYLAVLTIFLFIYRND